MLFLGAGLSTPKTQMVARHRFLQRKNVGTMLHTCAWACCHANLRLPTTPQVLSRVLLSRRKPMLGQSDRIVPDKISVYVSQIWSYLSGSHKWGWLQTVPVRLGSIGETIAPTRVVGPNRVFNI